jgi:hypothetical protein
MYSVPTPCPVSYCVKRYCGTLDAYIFLHVETLAQTYINKAQYLSVHVLFCELIPPVLILLSPASSVSHVVALGVGAGSSVDDFPKVMKLLVNPNDNLVREILP